MRNLILQIFLLVSILGKQSISQELPISLNSLITGGPENAGVLGDQIIDSYLNPAILSSDRIKIHIGGSFDRYNDNPTKYLVGPINNFHIYFNDRYKFFNYAIQIDEKVLRSSESYAGNSFARVRSIRSIVNYKVINPIKIGVLVGYDFYASENNTYEPYTGLRYQTVHTNNYSSTGRASHYGIGISWRIKNSIDLAISAINRKKIDNGTKRDYGDSYFQALYIKEEYVSKTELLPFSYQYPIFNLKLSWSLKKRLQYLLNLQYSKFKYIEDTIFKEHQLIYNTKETKIIEQNDWNGTRSRYEREAIFSLGMGINFEVTRHLTLFSTISLLNIDNNMTYESEPNYINQANQNSVQSDGYIKYDYPLFFGVSLNFTNAQIILTSNIRYYSTTSTSSLTRDNSIIWDDEFKSEYTSGPGTLRIGIVNDISHALKSIIYFSTYDSELRSDLFWQLCFEF